MSSVKRNHVPPAPASRSRASRASISLLAFLAIAAALVSTYSNVRPTELLFSSQQAVQGFFGSGKHIGSGVGKHLEQLGQEDDSGVVMAAVPRPRGKVNVGYFTNWGIYARKYKPQDVPAASLTHILYAFANVRPETGEVYLTDLWSDEQIHYDGDSWNDQGTNLYGSFKQLFLLKKKHRHLKLLLSIGGWTYSSNLAGPGASPEKRATFVRSSVKLLEDYGLDGLDVDWEYPQDRAQAENYVSLLKELREGLDAHGARKGLSVVDGYELTIAAPAGPSNYEKLLVREMDRYLSFWNLMAYDYAGSWDPVANHQANLFAHGDALSTDKAVRWYTAQGVPADKIVIGIPLYGRSFLATKGPGSPYNGVGQGSWEAGTYDYKALPLPGSTVGSDTQLAASWCHKADNGEWVSYDTPEVAAMKVSFINQHGIGGAMYWELSGDFEEQSPQAIVPLVARGIGALDARPNHLVYAESKFDNLKAGMPS